MAGVEGQRPGEQPKQPTFADVPRETILKAADHCNGWQIFPASEFTELGVPVEVVDPLVTTYHSDTSDDKTTIYKGGEVVDADTGIMGIHFLERVCRDLGIDSITVSFGRGSQVAELRQKISKHLEPKQPLTEPQS